MFQVGEEIFLSIRRWLNIYKKYTVRKMVRMGKKEGMKRNGNKNGISNEKGYDKKKSAMGIMRMV